MQLTFKQKETLLYKYNKCLTHVKIGEDFIKKPISKYKKTNFKRDYFIRRGVRAKIKLTQYESIPFLSKGAVPSNFG